MARGRTREYDIADERIVALRRAGHSCRSVADELCIPQSHVWNVMQRTGNAGRYHAAPKRDGHQAGRGQAQKRRREQKLEELVEQYDVVTIAAGLNGGYIVTLDDEWTGEERQGITAALASAVREAEHAND